MMKILAIINIFFLIFPTFVFAADENLDEAIARISRLSTATYGKDYLENDNYIWQPETLIYTDTATGKEVHVVVKGNLQSVLFGKEYALNAWSCDGSILGLFIPLSQRTSDYSGWSSNGYYKRWLASSDGKILRAAGGYANDGISEGGFGWAHTELAYYGIGVSSSWDADPGMLVKNSVDRTLSVTGSTLLNLNQADTDAGYTATTKGFIKRAISSNDQWLSISSRDKIDRGLTIDCLGHMRVKLNAGISPSIQDYWGLNRNIDTFYDHLKSEETKAHGGANVAWGKDQEYSFIQYNSATGGNHIWFRLKTSGSASDGGPKFEAWDGDSYGENEVYTPTYGPISTNTTDFPDSKETPDYGHQYWNHPAFDMWEKYILTGLGDTTGHNNELSGPGCAVRDIDAGTEYIELVRDLADNPDSQYDGYHHCWNGWTDEVVFFPAYVGATAVGQETIYARHINFTDQTKDSAKALATTHLNGETSNYNAYPRPSQSPDGTKVAFSNYFLNGDVNYPYVSYVVSKYPHPPEIISVSSGTVRFSWNLSSSPRGYTTRGWPDEDVDNPPPPRETAYFRLWKSADGSTNWTPVGTVPAEIFTRYDFATGKWRGNNYWEIKDPNPSGYYAITAIEWSGLESRTLSNIYKYDNTQFAAYPSDPGGDANITSTYNPALHRYYNIYAKDGATPTISQATRIASDARDTKIYIDWLGNTDGTTQYVVTAVDTQGNESAALPNISVTPTGVPGHYKINWRNTSYLDGNSHITNIGTGASKVTFK